MRRVAAAGAAMVLASAGCGGEPLSAGDAADVEEAVADLSFYCSEGSFARRAPAHVERLIEIYREDPAALHLEGQEEEQDMRGVLETTAENLDFEDCDPALARRIRRAL